MRKQFKNTRRGTKHRVILGTPRFLRTIPEKPCKIDPTRRFVTSTPGPTYSTAQTTQSNIKSTLPPSAEEFSKQPLILLISWHRYHAFRKRIQSEAGVDASLINQSHILTITSTRTTDAPQQPMHESTKWEALQASCPPYGHYQPILVNNNFINRPEMGVGGVETPSFFRETYRTAEGGPLSGEKEETADSYQSVTEGGYTHGILTPGVGGNVPSMNGAAWTVILSRTVGTCLNRSLAG